MKNYFSVNSLLCISVIFLLCIQTVVFGYGNNPTPGGFGNNNQIPGRSGRRYKTNHMIRKSRVRNNWNQYGSNAIPHNPYSQNVFLPDNKQNSKHKVDELGATLKRYVHNLRNTANGKVDIVFLVDSSASVGEKNFFDELKFVRKLLADFRVDQNTTRVAVITFSSETRVMREVDQMSWPSDRHHKCSLLEEELPAIKYTGGGTYTLGAMMDAQRVLRYSRPDARKAVFLMTDGYSNSGDPKPVAEQLKHNNVEIFTFGIRNGNQRELLNMSSEPHHEHTYILHSFEEFEALARRALHEDLHSGSYVPQHYTKCATLCEHLDNCCDRRASCRCGTHTGKYECMCDSGYYGNGLLYGCKPCPAGTYKSGISPGDITTCMKCPDSNHMSPPGSTSIEDCYCKRGFQRDGPHSCKAMTCPYLNPPENGYSVQDKCSNVFNAACGIRCNPGYKMIGSSVRLCQVNGKWSGTDTQCVVKKCPRLLEPKNGHMSCSKEDFSFETQCHFRCNPGFKLVGSKIRKCLAISYWNGITAQCREVKCKEVPELIDGKVTPSTCTQVKSPYGQTCKFTCRKGYKLAGPYSKQCTEEGSWTQHDVDNKCIDITPPSIKCPPDVSMTTDAGESVATISWNVPFATDNSMVVPSITVIPALVPPSMLPIGNTTIHYVAEDTSKNKAKCSFTVFVKDTEPPRIDKCVSPPPFIKKSEAVKVTWEEPIFSDNSGVPPKVKKTHTQPKVFPIGETNVMYMAKDQAGNNNTCIIKIVVKEHACANTPPPINGDLSCSNRPDGLDCKLRCKPGYGFHSKPAKLYHCDYQTGNWTPAEKMPFPDCAKIKPSNFVIQRSAMKYRAEDNCEDHLLLNQAEVDFQNRLSNKVEMYCDSKIKCSIEKIDTLCTSETGDEFDNDEELLFNQIDENLNPPRLVRRKRDLFLDQLGLFDSKTAVDVGFEVSGKLKEDTVVNDFQSGQKLLVDKVNEVMEKIKEDARGGNLHYVTMEDPHHELEFLEFKIIDKEPKFQCLPGSVQQESNCVNCPVGTFFNVMEEACEGCERGTYQPVEGQLTCMVCPNNMSTAVNSAKSVSQCKGQCLPGSYSSDGLELCVTCPRGMYQPDYGKNYCIMCPDQTTTYRRGSRTLFECGERCPAGYISKTGLKPCFPCPRGYFQPETGRDSCFSCPGYGSTYRKGSTQVTDCEGIDGEDERGIYNNIPTTELTANECIKEPCVNDGVCVALDVGYTCNCTDGYTGIHCEIEIDECMSNPCLNNATCTDFLAGYNCSCSPGFSGDNCEHNIDECISLPCMNNGTCRDDVDGYHCDCPSGFNGTVCEIDIDDCAESPCQNNGLCEDGVAVYTCVCLPGFLGDNCEIDVDECRSSPCGNNATCVDLTNAFRCDCPPGWTGEVCDEAIDECQSDPCENGATCVDGLAQYTCVCPPAYTGVHCQTKLNATFDLVFSTGAVTEYSLIEVVRKNLTEVTVAFFMSTNDKENYGAVLSYATDKEENCFTITDYQGFVIYVNGKQVITDITANDDKWHHIAVTWTSNGGKWSIYKDGELEDSGSGLADGQTLQSGGALVLGQEQDARGSGFSTRETFIGSMSKLNMWDRVLTDTEIKAITKNCDEYLGTVAAWADFLGGLQGRVEQRDSILCHDCPVPKPPNRGFVTWSGLDLDSVATYSCERGYNISGSNNLKCRIDSQWQTMAPVCEIIQCPSPGLVYNAEKDNLNYSYSNTVRFTCYPGYQLEGNGSRYCNEYGEWEGEQPRCNEIFCPRPPSSPHLVLTGKKNSYKPGHVLRFTCSFRHRLSGPKSLKCEEDGEWDSAFPSCDKIFCFNPPKIENGHAVARKNETFEVSEVVHYTCDEGFKLKFLKSLACMESGSWASELPVCEPVTCNYPVVNKNSQVKGDNFTYQSLIEYFCDDGFRMIGKPVLQCTALETWNDTAPYCEEILCQEPIEIKNGHIIYESLGVGAVVAYSCDKGYALSPNIEQSRCLENGTWEREAPLCVPITCPIPLPLENGQVIGDNFNQGDAIEYTCDAGFYLKGSQKSICTKNGTWSLEPPVCKEVMCGPPLPIKYGTHVPVAKEYKHLAVIKYKCESNYMIDHKSTRTCQGDGTWSGPTPKCILQKCFSPKPIEHGKLIANDITVGSIIEYVCDEGYQLEGPTQRTCDGNKTWTGSDPTCGQLLCPEPEDIAHGLFSQEKIALKSVLKYSCKKGYTLVGESIRVCEDGKSWNGTAPKCEAVRCDDPSDIISNGRMISSNFSYGATIEYICDSGYYIDGKTSRFCNEDGEWEDPIPVCERVECPRPGRPPNCNMDGFDFRYKEVVTYICKEGYELVGPLERVCQADKTWSGVVPKCVEIKCPELADIPNGKVLVQGKYYHNKVTYQCNPGYWLIGDHQRTCEKSKKWSGEAPKCKKVQCGEPPIVDGGDFVADQAAEVGDILEYKCKSGYVLVSPSNLTCTKHGNYTGDKPRCVQVRCSEPEKIDHGSLVGYDDVEKYLFGYIVRYVCRPGFVLRGDDLRKCSEDGTWSGKLPICEELVCGMPPLLVNGVVSAPNGYGFAETIHVSCDKGFQLVGEKERKCEGDGNWSGPDPVCEEVSCPKPSINNGYITVSAGSSKIKEYLISLEKFKVGMILDFACEKGFELKGANGIQCLENATWSNEIPTCVKVQCPEPNVTNAIVEAKHGFVFDSKISFECLEGHDLIGEKVLYCKHDKTWTKPFPKCQLISCPPLSLKNGKRAVVRSPNHGVGYPFGIVVSFECNFGYELIGEAETTCMGDKSWSNKVPECKLTFCNSLKLPGTNTGLYVKTPKDAYPHGYEIEFGCKDKYELNELEKVVCGSGGEWEGTFPECQMMECENPEIENGYAFSHLTRYITRFRVGVSINFRCNDGYQLEGAEGATCLANKTWSVEMPMCKVVKCEKPQIENGKLILRGDVNDFTHGTSVSIGCNEGYHLHGSSYLVCLSSGEWSQKIPYCAKVICNKPSVLYGTYTVEKQQETSNFVYEDIINIKCDSGFEYVGENEIMCDILGEWTNPNPRCEPVKCKEPFIFNGDVEVIMHTIETEDPDRKFRSGTVIGVTCMEGYQLSSNTELLCMEDGTWSDTMPVCEMTMCSLPDIPNAAIEPNKLKLGFKAKISISCKNDTELIGDNELTCSSNGTWVGDHPSCVEKACPTPIVSNGGVSEKYRRESYRYDAIVTFQCDSGFELSENIGLKCLPNRRWSAFFPSCQPVVCDPLPDKLKYGTLSILHARYENTKNEDFSYNTNVTVTCDLGYEVEGGSEKITCDASGNWSPKSPKCLPKICNDPVIENGVIHGEPVDENGKYTFRDHVRFTCNTGFVLEGVTEMLCQPDGTWTDPLPQCKRISCGVPKHLEFGTVNGDSFLYEDMIFFECNIGFRLSGPSKSTCLSSKSWTKYPSCTRIACPLPPDIKNGEYMAKTGFKYNDTIRYACHRGYELVGEQDHQCTEKRTWSGEIPSCRRVKCPSPAPIPHATFIGDSYLYQDTVRIQCAKGYVLKGDDTMNCQWNGRWKKGFTQCAILSCRPPPIISNGVLSVTNRYVYNSTATYTCDEGYEIHGEQSITCNEDAEWDNPAPSCMRIYCPKPASINNGYIEGSQYPYKSIVIYHCHLGYKLIGEAKRECTKFKSWTGETPSCETIMCSKQRDIANGRILSNNNKFGSVIEYACDEGYEVKGSVFRTCEADGSWSGDEPRCDKLSCPVPVDIDNGYTLGESYEFGSIVEYFCKQDYEIVGNGSRKCQGDRTWSGTTPHCKIKHCAPPSDFSISHGRMVGDDYSAGSIISFQCDAGYKLTGPSKVTCQGGTSWSSEFPQCDKVTCAPPIMMKHADIDETGGPTKDLVRFKCKKGYYLVGDNKIKCLDTGEWTPIRGRCNPVSCGLPPKVPFTIMNGNRYTFGDYIFYKCKEGYEMSGNNILECAATGKWSGELPVCRKISCGHVPVIKHATITVSKETFGSQAKYQCNKGYVLKGDPVAVCIANGTWSYSNTPECLPIDCGEPPAIPGGNIKYESTTFQSLVTYFCIDGYNLKGSGTRICVAEGLWNGTVPSCQPISCPKPETPTHGSLEGRDYTFGNDITYSCDVGYELVGDLIRSCEANGQWSGQNPRCDLVICGQPMGLENGNFTHNGSHYNSVVHYTCNDGYQMVGESSATCNQHGLWSGPAPICMPKLINVPCPSPNNLPANAADLTDDGAFMVGDSLLIACKHGFAPTADMTITCQEDMSWSKALGECAKVSCDPPKVAPGIRLMGSSYLYGDRIVYMCRPGLLPVSKPVITCHEDGTWDHVPECKATCKFECQNGGQCVAPNKCKCMSGWGGRFCEIGICILPCMNGGHCSGPYKCSCPPGYQGARCQVPTCDPPCANGGECVRPNRCRCPYGYRPPTCQSSSSHSFNSVLDKE